MLLAISPELIVSLDFVLHSFVQGTQSSHPLGVTCYLDILLRGNAYSKHFPFSLLGFFPWLLLALPFFFLFPFFFYCPAKHNKHTQPGDPAPSAPPPPTKLVSQNNQNAGGLGIGIYAVGIAIAALAFGIYTYLQKSADAQGTK